jgi:hypothetical protein
MDPKQPETPEERIYAAEFELQRLSEEFKIFNAAMCQDIDEVRQEGRETRAMVIQTNQVIALMPSQIIKAIKEESRTKHLDVNTWVGLVCTVIIAGAALWGIIGTHVGAVVK